MSRWIALVWSVLAIGTSAAAQLKEIDPAKLPQDSRVQSAYKHVLPIESLAREWSPKWSYATPKEQVVSVLNSSLKELNSTEAEAAQNEEFWLLRGVVAHLAYNVDVEQDYQIAIDSFEKARNLAPADYRVGWLFGMHLCQSNQIKAGMEQLLAIEDQVAWQKLPIDFWGDYITCSTISLMPAHTLRAVDHAVRLGGPATTYDSVVDIARKRYKFPSTDATYGAHDAWQAIQQKDDVFFTSQLCGIGFTARSDWRMDVRDVAKGTCVASMGTGPYPSSTGRSSPSLLILARVARPQETLEDYVRSILADRYVLARPTAGLYCPASKCTLFEIRDAAVYQENGGGHSLVAAFSAAAPDFPGLVFELPDAPPTQSSGPVTYYRATPRLHRFPGTLYYIVLLDSNSATFDKAKVDLDYLLRSIKLDCAELQIHSDSSR